MVRRRRRRRIHQRKQRQTKTNCFIASRRAAAPPVLPPPSSVLSSLLSPCPVCLHLHCISRTVDGLLRGERGNSVVALTQPLSDPVTALS